MNGSHGDETSKEVRDHTVNHVPATLNVDCSCSPLWVMSLATIWKGYEDGFMTDRFPRESGQSPRKPQLLLYGP
jgi:hypothetical protein